MVLGESGEMRDSRVVFIGMMNTPNVIDPTLRRLAAKSELVRLFVIIINVLSGSLMLKQDYTSLMSSYRKPHDVSQQELRSVASRAHGYVVTNLSAIVRDGRSNTILVRARACESGEFFRIFIKCSISLVP